MNFRFKKADIGRFASADADAALTGFQKNSRIIGLTNGRFSLIDLIHSVLKKTGPAHVICTTWSAGIKDAHQVAWMIDTALIKSFQLVTDHSFVTRQSKYALSITDLFGPDNIRTTEVHAKFVLIFNDDYNVVIRTSMNLNANRTCEVFEIDEDQEIFDFFMKFIQHTFADMPLGFTSESWRANKSISKFFAEDSKHKSWSEI